MTELFQGLQMIAPVMAGIMLAAATGFRAFLPLAVIAWAGRLHSIELSPTFRWLTSDAALISLSVAVLLEFIGDKFPVIDHVLDAAGAFIKPVAGALLVAASLTELDPVYATLIGIAAGGITAEGVHIVKAKSRLFANVATLGFAAPVLSLLEDLISILLIVIAILFPLMAIVFSVALILYLMRRLGRPATGAR